MAEMTIRQLSDKLQAYVNNIDKTIEKVVLSNSDLAIRLNQNQLLDGEMPDDSPIVPSYFSSSYATFKNRLNPRPGLNVPDLNLTGGNYNGIRFVKKGKKYFLENVNDKAPMLIKKYGDYMGLNKTSSKTFRNKNDKDLIVDFRRQTGL